MWNRAALLIMLLAACTAPTPVSPLRVSIIDRAEPHFEGEPAYLLIVVRNYGPAPIAAPWNAAACAELSMSDSAGTDLRRVRVWIDFAGSPAPLNLRSDSLLYWVAPLHWFYGREREPLTTELYSTPPGLYRVEVSLQNCAVYGAPGFAHLRGSLQFRVVPRTEEQSAARAIVLAAIDSATALVRSSRQIASALPTLTALANDSALVAYRPYVLLVVCR